MRSNRCAAVVEGVVLVVLTLTASFGIFEVLRRVPPLRPWFGSKRADEPQAPAARVPRAA